MKKTAALLLAAILMITAMPNVFAIPLAQGTKTLNAQFNDGAHGNYDYVYFSPVKDENDSTKYPLMVWLHGRSSGKYPRAQLNMYEFSNWASDEYQARFKNAGGCFLIAPRAVTDPNNSWNDKLCKDLKGIIDSFIAENSGNIDTTRIYIAGYSTGGSMVWSMLSAYPDFFAAGLPLAAINQPKAADLKKLKNTSVWIFTSDNDPYMINETSDVLPNFQYLCGISNRSGALRMTSFSEAFYADGTKKTENGTVTDDAEHYIWESVTYDMFMDDGITPYRCATTKDCDGNTLTFTPGNAIITWLSEQTNEKTEDINKSFMERLVLFFNRLSQLIKELFSFFK